MQLYSTSSFYWINFCIEFEFNDEFNNEECSSCILLSPFSETQSIRQFYYKTQMKIFFIDEPRYNFNALPFHKLELSTGE